MNRDLYAWIGTHTFFFCITYGCAHNTHLHHLHTCTCSRLKTHTRNTWFYVHRTFISLPSFFFSFFFFFVFFNPNFSMCEKYYYCYYYLDYLCNARLCTVFSFFFSVHALPSQPPGLCHPCIFFGLSIVSFLTLLSSVMCVLLLA